MHVHNADPKAGPVCSHMVTDEMFVSWGIVTEQHSKCVGMDIISRPANAAGIRPTHAAWVAGKVRICTAREEKPWIGFTKGNHSPEWIAEASAWAESVVRKPAFA